MTEPSLYNYKVPGKGRGAGYNPVNRFEPILCEPDRDWDPAEQKPGKTQYFKDHAKTIISRNDSPDVGFETSINPYRGCEHGCVYCYARPGHEYFGLSAGLDFESKIFVKTDAARLLRKELTKKSWKPQVLVMSGVTDPYQPVERRLTITRQCLEVLGDFRNPVGIITKNALITRDLDLLENMHEFRGVCANISITTLNPGLARRMEPRASMPADRLRAIEQLAARNIPVRVMVAPIIPALNDEEIPAILASAKSAGARAAAYVLVRLPYANKELFETWLLQYFPDRKEKVLNRLKSMRKGKLYDPAFGQRMRGEGAFAEQVADLFAISARRNGLNQTRFTLSTSAFRRPSEPGQYKLFN